MKRALFCVVAEKGHINPTIAPAQWLRQMGFTVAFYAHGDVREQLTRAGFDLIFGASEKRGPNQGAAFAEQVRDPVWLRRWIRTLLIENVSDEVERIRAAIRSFAPDVIVIDPLVYAAAIAAKLEDLPWVSLSNSLNPVLDNTLDSELLRTVVELREERDALFASFGMSETFRGCDVLSPHLTIAFCTETFVGRHVAGVHQVGPSMPQGKRGDECEMTSITRAPDAPLIYMSLGSQIYFQPRMYERVIDFASKRDVTLVLSIGEMAQKKLLGTLAANVHVTAYAPQLQLLSRARAFITHGGANSVMEALHFGVPMLVSPLCNDQFHQATFVERAGVGRAIDLHAATDAEVQHAMDDVLGSPSIRDRARQIAASYKVDGARHAAELIASLTQRA